MKTAIFPIRRLYYPVLLIGAVALFFAYKDLFPGEKLSLLTAMLSIVVDCGVLLLLDSSLWAHMGKALEVSRHPSRGRKALLGQRRTLSSRRLTLELAHLFFSAPLALTITHKFARQRT